jgi:glycosyltransferase involved in cell wall biosynthesis
MMKILQITPTFIPSKFGGVKTISFNISRVLANGGHSVTVYTTDAEIGNKRLIINNDHTIIEKIQVNYFKNINNIIAYRFRIFLPIGFYKTIKKEIRNFDIIHVHDFRSILSIIVWYYAKKFHIPYIIQAHGSVLPYFGKLELKKIFDKIWGNRILMDASHVIAVSSVEKLQYIQMGVPEEKIKIIFNGIEVSDYEILPERKIFRKKYGIRSDEKVILYLGRLHKNKGIDFLINGFSSFLGQYNCAKLVIIGPDDGFLNNLKKQVRKLKIEDKVIFSEPLYKSEKFEAFVDADIVVYPAQNEIFGLVPFESIMCGTPVIVSKNSGCGEIIEETKCGSVIKYGDINELRLKMEWILLNHDESQKMIELGKSFISNCLAWDKIIKNFENIYSSSIKKSSNFLEIK